MHIVHLFYLVGQIPMNCSHGVMLIWNFAVLVSIRDSMLTIFYDNRWLDKGLMRLEAE